MCIRDRSIAKVVEEISRLSYGKAREDIILQISKMYYLGQVTACLLYTSLERDLDYFSGDIKKMIASEIIKRYYYQRGNIIQQLKDDDGLKDVYKRQ